VTGNFLTRKKSVAQPEYSGNAEKTPSSPLPFYTVYTFALGPFALKVGPFALIIKSILMNIIYIVIEIKE